MRKCETKKKDFYYR